MTTLNMGSLWPNLKLWTMTALSTKCWYTYWTAWFRFPPVGTRFLITSLTPRVLLRKSWSAPLVIFGTSVQRIWSPQIETPRRQLDWLRYYSCGQVSPYTTWRDTRIRQPTVLYCTVHLCHYARISCLPVQQYYIGKEQHADLTLSRTGSKSHISTPTTRQAKKETREKKPRGNAWVNIFYYWFFFLIILPKLFSYSFFSSSVTL